MGLILHAGTKQEIHKNHKNLKKEIPWEIKP